MARTRSAITNLTRGELDPLLLGRADLEQYYNGAETLENIVLHESGAGSRRAGTRFVAATKDNLFTRLVPFVFSQAQVYLLEFSEGALRIRRNNGTFAAELATPYLEEDLKLLRFEQSADVLYIACNFYQPRTLSRFSDTIWKLHTFPTVNRGFAPIFEYGERPVATLTPSATSGTGVTFTASGAQFLLADVGRFIQIFAGANTGARAFITGFTSATQVTGDIIDAWTDLTPTAATDWKMTDSPRTTLTPSVAGPVNAPITLTAAVDAFRSTDVGKFVAINGGVVFITGFTSPTVVTGSIGVVLTGTGAAQAGAWFLEESSWTPFNGFPAAVALGGGRLAWAGTLAQPNQFWASAAGDFEMYLPGILDDDAIDFALDSSQVNSVVWMQASGRDFLIGTLGAEVSLSGGTEQPLTPSNVISKVETAIGSSPNVSPLNVGTVVLFPAKSDRRLRELVFSFEQDRYLAPDLLLLAKHLTRGQGKRLVSLAYQREPISTIWAARSDGQFLACTYLREQNVVAWARHNLSGATESVAVIPHPDGDRDQVWVVVRRELAGATIRHLEFIDDSPIVYDRRHVDAAAVFDFTKTANTALPAATSGVGVHFFSGDGAFQASDVGKQIRRIPLPGVATITTFVNNGDVIADIISPWPDTSVMGAGTWAISPLTLTGLGHLAGSGVDILGDGAVFPVGTVSLAGELVLDATAVRMEVGFAYDSVVVPVRRAGSRAVPRHVAEVYVELFESLGLEINGEQVLFRTTGNPLGSPPPLFTGGVKVPQLGIGEGRITIAQRQPLPFTITYIEYLTASGE